MFMYNWTTLLDTWNIVNKLYFNLKNQIKKKNLGLPWRLGLHASTAGDMGLVPGQGTKIPQTVQRSQKKELAIGQKGHQWDQDSRDYNSARPVLLLHQMYHSVQPGHTLQLPIAPPRWLEHA